MIYKKYANFPYPILTNTSNSYDNCSFILDIDLEENTNEYIFEIKYDITSPFIQGLLKNGQATLILIIKSKDNKFFNSVIFNGSNNKPLELFEKKVNPNLKSDVNIELGSETIIINYKNESLQFTDLPQSSTFNNPYVYMGLQKALYRFIVNNSEDHESVDLEEMEPPNDGLDFKLYNLMRKKKISELNIENIDEVIYSISDKMLEKYTAAVRRLYSNGN